MTQLDYRYYSARRWGQKLTRWQRFHDWQLRTRGRLLSFVHRFWIRATYSHGKCEFCWRSASGSRFRGVGDHNGNIRWSRGTKACARHWIEATRVPEDE